MNIIQYIHYHCDGHPNCTAWLRIVKVEERYLVRGCVKHSVKHDHSQETKNEIEALEKETKNLADKNVKLEKEKQILKDKNEKLQKKRKLLEDKNEKLEKKLKMLKNCIQTDPFFQK